MMTSNCEEFPLRRRTVVEALLRDRGDMLVVAGLGAPAWDVAAAGDSDLDFPLWGAMGGAAMIGLGLALAQPERRVLVITGDGEMLMGIGSLATIAASAPANLAIVVLDNERYGETGMQQTHTAWGADLAALAQSSGFPVTALASDEEALDSALHLARDARGPVFITIKIRAESPPLVLPPRDGEILKNRFRQALIGEH
ncbi:MAG: thiamine pyrophosphate-dependent enzyme [Alphaproteobacteria bacterium]|jgi:thiamine pyrophosphate-dependent acetolactate synthase large subunit-like protein